MKSFIFIFITYSLFAQSVDVDLEKLLTYKQDKKLLHVSYNPFKRSNTTSDIKKVVSNTLTLDENPKFVLKAIFNKKAFINSMWYEKGDKIDNVIVQKITENSVFIKEGSKVNILKLEKFKKFVIVKEK